MARVLVGSTSTVKIRATESAFLKYFQSIEVVGIKVSSLVHEQPIGNETMEGAINRAKALAKIDQSSDFFVGIEGGIANLLGQWFCFGAICVIDKNGQYGYGLTPCFQLPDEVLKQVLDRKELSGVIDLISGRNDSKDGEGAIGFLTRGVITKQSLYEQGIITALIPLIKYFKT